MTSIHLPCLDHTTFPEHYRAPLPISHLHVNLSHDRLSDGHLLISWVQWLLGDHGRGLCLFTRLLQPGCYQYLLPQFRLGDCPLPRPQSWPHWSLDSSCLGDPLPLTHDLPTLVHTELIYRLTGRDRREKRWELLQPRSMALMLRTLLSMWSNMSNETSSARIDGSFLLLINLLPCNR